MALQITPAAMDLIRERVARAGIANAVVRFIEQSAPHAVSQSVVDDIRGLSGNRSRRRPANAMSEMELEMQLVPAVYPRERVGWWQLEHIGDLTFAVPLISRFAKRQIDVGAGCLVLRDGRGKVLLPQTRRLP